MACDTLTDRQQRLLDDIALYGTKGDQTSVDEWELLAKVRDIVLDHKEQVAMNEILRRKKGLLNERNKFLNDALRKLKEKLVVAETKLRKELT